MNKRIALIAVIFGTIIPGLADACRCMAPEAPTMESVRIRFCEADVVFMGEVTDEQVVDHGEVYPGKETIFKLSPEAVYRGPTAENYSARFVSTASCDYRFQTGSRYLVFANDGMDPNEIRVSTCGETVLASDAEIKTRFIDMMLAEGADPCDGLVADPLEKTSPGGPKASFGLTTTATTVSLVDQSPTQTSALNAHDPVYLRLSYRSTGPIRFQAAGVEGGEKVEKGMRSSPAVEYPAGKGEAIVWVSYSGPQIIDEIVVEASDSQWRPLSVITHPIDAHWSGVVGRTRPDASDWAVKLNAEQQALVTAGIADTSEPQESTGGSALLNFISISVPGYFVLQIFTLFRLRERWRKFALLPLVVMVPLLAYTLFALLAGSGLWPLMLLFVTPFAFAYLVILLVIWIRSEHNADVAPAQQNP